MPLAAFLIILASLSLSAFFSGIEIAFISANKLRLAINIKEGGLIWRIIQRYQNNPASFISTTLVGNNIALVIYGIKMGELMDPLFAKLLPNQSNLTLLATTLISTLIVLVTAEYLPKVLFRINPIAMLKALILPFRFFHMLFWPFISLILFISNSFLRLITGKNQQHIKQVFTHLDLNQIIGESTQVALDEYKSLDTEMFKNALDYHQLKVRDCMKPRTEIVALDEEEGVDGLYKIFIESRHSKIPIYRENIDNIIGYAHQGSMFVRPENIHSALIPVVITNESMPVSELMKTLNQANKSLALVVDEFGGTAGIVTIEDIMEEIFGEIEDEYDSEKLKETQIKPGHYILSARLEVEYINKNYPLQIPEGDYETLGGFISYYANKIPTTNELVYIQNLEIKILGVENARIIEVEIKDLNEQ